MRDSLRRLANMAAAQIYNTLTGMDAPSHVIYGRIVAIILKAMTAAYEESKEGRREPSEN